MVWCARRITFKLTKQGFKGEQELLLVRLLWLLLHFHSFLCIGWRSVLKSSHCVCQRASCDSQRASCVSQRAPVSAGGSIVSARGIHFVVREPLSQSEGLICRPEGLLQSARGSLTVAAWRVWVGALRGPGFESLWQEKPVWWSIPSKVPFVKKEIFVIFFEEGAHTYFTFLAHSDPPNFLHRWSPYGCEPTRTSKDFWPCLLAEPR